MTTEEVPLFPLSQGLFPEGFLSLMVFEVRYLHLMKRCQHEGLEFGVVPLAAGSEVQKAGEIEQLHGWGCMARIVQVESLQPAVLAVKCIGTQRFRLDEHARGAFGLWHGQITVQAHDLDCPIKEDLQPLANRLGELIATAQQQVIEDRLPMAPPYRLDDCGWVANRWGDILPIPSDEKATLLSESDCEARLRRIQKWFEE
jgi:Lon protease-like protein